MVSLTEFAANRRPVPGATERWFQERPDVREQVDAGLASNLPAGVIWKWLRAEHDFPLSQTALHGYRDRKARDLRAG